MFFDIDNSSRDKLLLERRKAVQPGNSGLEIGDLFTISFNLATGDRSYMDGIWKVLHTTPQQVYAECVLNPDRAQTGGMFDHTGRRHLFDRSEYQFYDAKQLHDLIVEERKPIEVSGLLEFKGGVA